MYSMKYNFICDVAGFQSGVSDYSVRLGYDVSSLDNRFPMFRGNVPVSFSTAKWSKKNDTWTVRAFKMRPLLSVQR